MVLVTTTLLGWMTFGSYLHLPDGYALDYDRTPARYARPVDRDNVVSLNVPGGRFLGGASISLRYDEEDRSMGDDADAVSIRFQWKF
jgi:hypothetical protein